MEKLYPCYICKIYQVKSAFYKCKNSYYGIQSYCKKCEKIRTNKRKKEKLEYFRRWRKSKAGIKYFYDNREKINKQRSEWKKKYFKNLNDELKKHYKAREIFKYAIKSGKMERGKCMKCGKPNAQGHHFDYSKPLEVIWLCKKHHLEEHNRLRAKPIS
jgi:hypothetical protein